MPQNAYQDAYKRLQDRISLVGGFQTTDQKRIKRYQEKLAGPPPGIEQPTDAPPFGLPKGMMTPMPKNLSIYEKPGIETTKSLDGWMDNFASDWGQFIDGMKAVVPTILSASKEIWENREYLPLIFNKTLPQESMSENWLKKIAPFGDFVDSFQLGRELLFTTSHVMEAMYDPYKDGVVEALYTHPFFAFLDATAVASVMAKGVSGAGRIAAKTSRANAVSKVKAGLIQRGLQGADLDRMVLWADKWDGMDAYRSIVQKSEKIAKEVALAPYFPFTAPFRGANKLLTGKLKDAFPGRMYTSFKESTLTDEIAMRIHRIIGSHNSHYPMQMAVKGQAILQDLGKLTQAESNYFLDNVMGLDKILQHYPDSQLTGMIDTPNINPERLALIREKALLYKKTSFDYENQRLEQGFMTEETMTASRASTALNWIAHRRAQIEIARQVAAGARTQKKFFLFGEEVMPRADRAKIHSAHRKELLERKKNFEDQDKPGDIHLRNMIKALDDIELREGASRVKEVPYLPWVHERTFDGAAFIHNMLTMTVKEFKDYRGDMKRRSGAGVVSMDPHVVVMRHLKRQEEVNALRAGQAQIIDEFGDILKKGQAMPEGFDYYDYKYMFEHYFPTQQRVMESINSSYLKWVRDLSKVHPNDPLKVEHLAMKHTYKEWAGSTKGLTETKKIADGYAKLVQDPKAFDVRVILPKQAIKAIKAHLEQLTGPLGIYQKGLNIFRFMALNMFPRFYINNAIGNAIQTLFAGGAGHRVPKIKREAMPEASQSMLIQEPGFWTNSIYGNAWFGSRGYSKFLEWFQSQVEYPGRIMTIAHKLEGLIQEAKFTKTAKAGKAAMVGMEEAFPVFLKAYRDYQLKGSRSMAVVNHMEYGAKAAASQMRKRANLMGVEEKLITKLNQLVSEEGTTYGKQIILRLAKVNGDMFAFKKIFEDLGMSKTDSRFFKEVNPLLEGRMTEVDLSMLREYLKSPEAWDDIVHSVSDKNRASGKTALNSMIKKVDTALNQLGKLDRRDAFIRSTRHMEPEWAFAEGSKMKQPLVTDDDILIHLRNTMGLGSDLEKMIKPKYPGAGQEWPLIKDLFARANDDLAQVGWKIRMDFGLGGNLAGSRRADKTIRVNTDAIFRDYQNGLPYLKGLDDSVGSIQKGKVFEGIDIDALKEWFEQNGRESRYLEFIIEHEKAHVTLGHLGRGVYPKDRLSPVAIALEREANEIAFRKIGYNLEEQALLPFKENLLWKSYLGLEKGSRESRQLVQEARKYAIEYHKSNRTLKIAQKRLNKLDPISLITKMEKELKKVLPDPEIAKIRHDMMEKSIEYMENFFGNYNSMHPIERTIVRKLFPFWTFPKTMFKLMWKLPGLRPKTAGLWANFSRYMLDATNPDTFEGRNSSSMIWGGDEFGNMIMARWTSWVPLEAAGLGRYANKEVMPRGLNPMLANPLIKLAMEWQVGQDLFTGRPFRGNKFLTTTGQMMEMDKYTGRFRLVTPQKDFIDGIFSLLPHWPLLREIVDPNYKTPKIGDEYVYDRKRWMGLGRLFGVSISVQDPEKQRQIDRYYRKLIRKKIRAAMKFRSTEERVLGRAMLKHLDDQERRNGQGDVWTLNPPY